MNENGWVWEDVVQHIHIKTGIDHDIIEKVLDAELDYMRELGLVYDLEEGEEK